MHGGSRLRGTKGQVGNSRYLKWQERLMSGKIGKLAKMSETEAATEASSLIKYSELLFIHDKSYHRPQGGTLFSLEVIII